MKNFLGIIGVLVFFCTGITTVHAQSVSVVNTPPASVRVYEKYEVHFTTATNYQNPFFQYDPAPPNGITTNTGVTIDGLFTANGKTWTQPAFYTTEVQHDSSNPPTKFWETNNSYWIIRFSPQETGTYQVTIRVTDAAGTTITAIGSFQATSSLTTNDGYIGVSKTDTRYFEFSDGKLYWPIGPALAPNYSRNKGMGLNFERFWMIGSGAYSSNQARWISSGDDHGNEGYMMPLNYTEHYPGHELSYQLKYSNSSGVRNGFRIWLSNWDGVGNGVPPRLFANVKPNTTYQIKLVYKAQNITGPRDTARPDYGFVIKPHNSSNNNFIGINDDAETFLAQMPSLIGQLKNSNGWTEIKNLVVTTNQSVSSRGELSLYLENVTSGEVYIDEFSMKECTAVINGICTGTSGEMIRSPRADIHTYVDSRGAAYMDWQLEQGELNGVYFKYVVHDKNDWITNHLLSNGQWSDNGGGYYQPKTTKAGWLLYQWYRYILARWGYSTAVHSWELNNEGSPNDTGHYQATENFAKYMNYLDDGTKRPDNHLTTTSFNCCWRPDFWNSTTTYKDVGHADIHAYTGHPDEEVGTDISPDGDTASWVIRLGDLVKNTVNKPVILGEFGISDPKTWSSRTGTLLSSPNSGNWYHNMLWAGLHPAALTSPNYWYTQHFINIQGDVLVARETISKPFYDFVSTLDVNKGGYADITANISPNSNLRAVGQKNTAKGKAHLWIQNLNSTWTNETPAPVTGTVSFSMNPGTYTLKWLDTYISNKLLKQETQTGGTLTLNVSNPPLINDVAVVIEPANGMPTNTPAPPSPTPTPKPGDANGDGKADGSDYLLWLSNFGLIRSNPKPTILQGNFNGDDKVDGSDYLIWLGSFDPT